MAEADSREIEAGERRNEDEIEDDARMEGICMMF